jgi:hypothetical protein
MAVEQRKQLGIIGRGHRHGRLPIPLSVVVAVS